LKPLTNISNIKCECIAYATMPGWCSGRGTQEQNAFHPSEVESVLG